MYLAVDVGGTKTLIGCFDHDGSLTNKLSFPTPHEYKQFVEQLREKITELGVEDFKMAGVGMPGLIDHKHGRVIAFGNLPWKNVPVQADIEKLINAPVVLENDAKLAGLSEANLIKDQFRKVLYITVSTGIGTGLIIDGVINPDFANSEGGQILLEHGGKLQIWEDFASGKAIVEKYGKRAEDIDDEGSWKEIARNLAVGFQSLIVITQPDVIVIGGGVGRYLDKFINYLKADLKKFENPLAPIPPILGAKRPDESVIYGAYLLAKQRFGAHDKKQ